MLELHLLHCNDNRKSFVVTGHHLLRPLILLVLLLLFGAAACGDDGPAEETATVVVGVTSSYKVPKDIDRLDLIMEVDGDEVRNEQLVLGSGAGTTNFPHEFVFSNVPLGALLEFTVHAYSEDVLMVVRHLSTEATFPDKRLIRIFLEERCALEVPDGSTAIPAPSCNEVSHTCISGKCQSAAIASNRHEVYTSDWYFTGNDTCKPADAPDPIIIVGEGQSDYLAMEDYASAQVEAGPQGGHHIWVAARIRNLLQSGSITSVGGEIPELGLSISPFVVIFTLSVDDGDYCKLFGLRFQIDVDGNPIQDLLGKQMKVIVTVEDKTGDIGVGERWVTLSTDTI